MNFGLTEGKGRIAQVKSAFEFYEQTNVDTKQK